MAGVYAAGNAGPTETSRIHAMPYGTHIAPDKAGVTFRLWAPTAQSVELMLNDQPLVLDAQADGWHTCFSAQARHGDLYSFRINGDLNVPDPASRYQPQDVHGPSQVVDPTRFEWEDTHWKGRPWEETSLYELHVGTFTPEGTYQGVKNKLDYLVDLGVTAIELMPLSDFPGQRNWGYDGVLPYAPDSSYGTPDDLKDLIQTAHQKGLMVFLDVVYNHFGPDGNYLHTYAKSFFTEHYHTPWGAAINFEGPRPVREFFIQNALYWLTEYHIDGLRFDAVHAIYDQSPTHFLNELAETVRSQIPADRHVHLVLENDDNASRFLLGKRQTHFDAQWNDDFHHAAHVIATGDASGYYSDYDEAASHQPAVAHLARCLSEGFAYQGEQSQYRRHPRGEKTDQLPLTAFVNFLQNHDQVGNRAFGERLHQLAPPEAMKSLTEVLLLAPSIPMLFMGEEWQSDRPFLFFCDFNPELSRLVTEGRRKEFARFPEFSNPETRERIPDPAAVSTFEQSRLDWTVLHQPVHAEWLALTRELLSIRKQAIIPHLAAQTHEAPRKPECKILEKSGMIVEWPLANGKTLVLVANPSATPLTLPSPLSDNIRSGRMNVIYQSGDTVAQEIESGTIPAWAVLWKIG
ncbi:MAG: 1,4-alpha-glucan branching protein [Vampirovibrio sp.]|nr:1,4-alpha-glucan branching protein [Vampirovibrio sp.]